MSSSDRHNRPDLAAGFLEQDPDFEEQRLKLSIASPPISEGERSPPLRREIEDNYRVKSCSRQAAFLGR
jgi:hypothetical protein